MSSLLIAFVSLTSSSPVSAAQDDNAQPATAAERAEFRQTARHAEVLDFIDQLAKRAPHVRRVDVGTTVEGRPLAAAIVAQPSIGSPADAAKRGKLVVLIIANIHSGECDGKEAMLALTRELAFDSSHPLLKQLVLIVVPNFNADGNERVAANNRPGQIGPDVMGRRENAQGLDLNRDFVKLET